MYTTTALLLALGAAIPASATFYEHVGRYSPPEATSPAKARFRAVKKEAMPAPTQAPEYHPDLGVMPLLKRAEAGTDTCGFHTDDGTRPRYALLGASVANGNQALKSLADLQQLAQTRVASAIVV